MDSLCQWIETRPPAKRSFSAARLFEVAAKLFGAAALGAIVVVLSLGFLHVVVSVALSAREAQQRIDIINKLRMDQEKAAHMAMIER